MPGRDEDALLRSVAMQNAQSILAARQRAEAELETSLTMMRATLESTWDGILVTDAGGRVTGFNTRFVEMWSIPPEVMESRDHGRILGVVGGQFAEAGPFVARVDEIYATSPPESFDELRLANGRVFERYSRIQVIEGRNAGRVWSFRDISDQRRADEAVRQEALMLELLNTTGIRLSSELDPRALVQAVTDAATQLSGARFGAFFYNVTDARGDTYRLYALSGAPREAFEKLGSPRATPLFGPTFRGEDPIRCDDVLRDPRYGTMPPHRGMPPGHLPVRSYLAVPVISRTGEVLGGLFFGHPEPGVFGERTERLVVGVAAQAAVALDNARLLEAAQKAAESERAARHAADRVSSMKDDFLATLSHELRTPLGAILGWSQILRARTMSEAELHRGLEVIERNARVQTQLIDDLLDMSRIAAGTMRLDLQSIDPASFVEAAIETVRPAAEAKGIALTRRLDPATGPVTGDPNRLQQVVWNLLSNAVKFTGTHGRIDVVLERAAEHVQIVVADTGAGIAPEFLPRVFDRFRQGDSSRTRTARGMGLGLSIVKYLVEHHGGEVEATSPGEGRGATFRVRLPLAGVPRGEGEGLPIPGRGPAAVSDFTRSDLSGIRVLVVDDQPDTRDLIKQVLEECRAEVVTAASADEALRALQRYRPAVLVSDIGLPEVDGYELLRRVRTLGPTHGGRTPAIAVTAFARSEDRTAALRAGFLVHVSKPVEPSELVATVASVVGRAGEPVAE
jgi:signal transduction histidine kinase/ActR/RegA family two-component response regulator